MTPQPPPSTDHKTLASPLRRFFRALTHGLRRPRASQLLFDELLYISGRTQSLPDLLTHLPQRLCDDLQLSSFHILLREGSIYALQARDTEISAPISLAASSSTVSRMRRDSKPAQFASKTSPHSQPDGWQLLAEPYEIDALNNLGAQLLLPLSGRMGLIGFATLARPDSKSFTRAELSFLQLLGPQIGRGLETARLVSSIAHQAVERAHADRELQLAREVQQRLLPQALPFIPGVDTAATYRSAGQIGGDYYDLFLTPSGEVCSVVADISGKGTAAALLMSALRASLHALMLQQGLTLPRLVEQLNMLLYQASAVERYATLFICTYNPAAASLTYVNAGHNPPFLVRAQGPILQLDCGGSVVGLLPQLSYESQTISLEPNDMLVAYTDGITEATNPSGQEWGEASLVATLTRCTTTEPNSAQHAADTVLSTLDAFTHGASQQDDLTLTILRRA